MQGGTLRHHQILSEAVPRFLYDLFEVAVERAQPRFCIPGFLPDPPEGRTIVIGVGKAAASMAQALEENWPYALEGAVITRYGHGAICRRIEVFEAGHPVPDVQGVEATRAILNVLHGVRENDLVICLISGGGSALLTALPPGVALEDFQAFSQKLLSSGARISEINCVRKHCSLVSGGRLARLAHPARLVTLAISDVPGDDISAIASGPTVADPTTRHDALAVLETYAITPPPPIADWLARPEAESVKRDEARIGEFHLIASPAMSLEAAAKRAHDAGFEPIVLGADLEGNARLLGEQHAQLVRELRKRPPAHRPRILLSGGETSVKVEGDGIGGRNGEYALALALALASDKGAYALAADTDGIDGVGQAAGAFIWPGMLADPACRRSAAAALLSCDSHSFFGRFGALLDTGPTQTNVNDFRAVLVDDAPALRNAANAGC